MSPAAEISAAAHQVILAFADDEHLMGQQHTEWIGVAPFLEEDLAFASIGQDELGHAALLLEVLVGDDERAIDELAFFREAKDWRSCALAECSLPEWSDTLVRHWLYDAAEDFRWQLFHGSSIAALAAMADRAESEERFHRRHADALLDVLLENDDAHARVTTSLSKLLPLALSLFDGVAEESQAVAEGMISAPLAEHLGAWKARVDERFGAIDWASMPTPAPTQRRERHADFAPLLARICEVWDLDRTVTW